MTNYKRKKPQDIIFRQMGGELVVWKRYKTKGEPKSSIFIKSHYMSELGGQCWELMGDDGPEIIPVNKIDLFDVIADYNKDK